MKRPKDIPTATRKAIETRSGGVCEACGESPAVEVHHRRYKSRGGGHEVTNLLHVCGFGNHTGCHGIAHSGRGEDLGWSVESGHRNPSEYRVLYRGAWVLLTNTGGITPTKREDKEVER